jgi:hypothetical protein
MRRLMLGIAIGAMGLLGTATAQAGDLTGAVFGLSVGTLGPLLFDGSATAVGTAVDSESATVMAGVAFKGTETTTLTAKQAPPLTKIVVEITKNDAIKVTGDPLQGNAAVGAVRGTALQKGFGGATLIGVPLAAGISDTVTLKGTFAIKAQSKKWTSGATTVTGLGSSMMATATFMTKGSVMTGKPGQIGLVAVSKVTVTGAADIITYTLARLDLEFTEVPEPTMPLMVLAGAATLALVGGRKLRKG